MRVLLQSIDPLFERFVTQHHDGSRGIGRAEVGFLQGRRHDLSIGLLPIGQVGDSKQKGVVEIELAPQKEADVIDNPIVFVKYKGKLDLDSTLKAISRAGFEAQEVAN